MVLARTTSIARTISSSAISGPRPASAPRLKIASCRASRSFLLPCDSGSPLKMYFSRPAVEPVHRDSLGGRLQQEPIGIGRALARLRAQSDFRSVARHFHHLLDG